MFAAIDLVGILATVIGLGGLIFFHELGHFLACRLTKTRVEAFSIGFGPELFGWRRGPTRYRVALIPLGGYVKMAAENPGDARSDAPDEFPNKSFAQRLFIMSNGVIFNIILAFVLYIWAFGVGVPFPTAKLGAVTHGGSGWQAGLQVGDLVTKVNGRTILGFDDLRTEVAFSSEGEIIRLTVMRGGKEVEVAVEPLYNEATGMPIIGVLPSVEPEMRGVAEGSPAEKGGGKVGDVVLTIQGKSLDDITDLPRTVGRAAGNAGVDAKNVPVTIVVRRKTGAEETLTVVAPLDDRPQIGIHPFSGNVVKRRADGGPTVRWLETGDKVLSVNGEAVRDFRSFRERADSKKPVKTIGIERAGKRETLEPDTAFTERELAEAVAGEADIESTRVAPRADMPAERAGVAAGDRIVRVGSTKVTNWTELQAAIVANGRKPVSITLERDGKTLDLTIEPGATVARPLLGYEFSQARTMQKEDNFLAAIGMGWTRTKLAIKSVALTIRSLVTRRVSARHIGGPITLARVTYDMFDAGLGRYLYILALISINLAILNILPIPVLDGGQIVLLCAEKLRGKPLPEKVVGYFQMVGLLLILGLLVLAFKNDIAMLLQ